MRKLWAGTIAIAGSLVTVAAPAGAASVASGGFAVTRVIVGGRVMSVAADPTTGIVYIANSAVPGNRIAAINTATNKVIATVSVPMFPRDVAVDSATDTVYAVGDSPAKVAVIDGATDTVTTTISMPSNAFPVAAAVSPSMHTLYVADDTNDSVDVFSTTSDKLTATIPLIDPSGSAIAVDTMTNQIYVSDANGSLVAVIDGATNTVTHHIQLPDGAFPRGIAAGSGAVYVADQDTNAISVIDTATDTVSATITGLTGVAGVALGPTGTLYAVAPDGGPAGLGITYVIDTAGRNVTAQIARGAEWVATDTGSAYLSDGYAALPSSVTVITPSSATTMCPAVLGPFIVTFTLGQARQVQIQASATPSASFSATGLPAGLTLSPAGVLSGTPTGTVGPQMAMVTAANGFGPPDTEPIDIDIDQPPVITSAARATFQTGALRHFDAIAKGYPSPKFSEVGALPKGVRFSTFGYSFSSVGELAGVPAQGSGGRYPITLTADNGAGTPATQKFTLTVDQPPSFASSNHVTFRVGRYKTFTIVTRGFPAAQVAESGKLPRGISFRRGHNGTATLSGKAFRRARGRIFRIILTARNSVGPGALQVLTIVIR